MSILTGRPNNLCCRCQSSFQGCWCSEAWSWLIICI